MRRRREEVVSKTRLREQKMPARSTGGSRAPRQEREQPWQGREVSTQGVSGGSSSQPQPGEPGTGRREPAHRQAGRQAGVRRQLFSDVKVKAVCYQLILATLTSVSAREQAVGRQTYQGSPLVGRRENTWGEGRTRQERVQRLLSSWKQS